MTSATPDPAPSRRERRRREVHARIIEAAAELFARKGFSGTTALEIADTADIAEKTFYNHFPTKQHLIAELAQRSLEDTSRLLAEVSAFPGTTVDRLRHLCDRAVDFAELASRDLVREVLLEIMRVSPLTGAASEWNDRLQNVMRMILREGHATGNVVARESDLAFHAELAVAAYLGMFIHWVTMPDYPLRDRLRQLATGVVESLEQRCAHRPREDLQ